MVKDNQLSVFDDLECHVVLNNTNNTLTRALMDAGRAANQRFDAPLLILLALFVRYVVLIKLSTPLNAVLLTSTPPPPPLQTDVNFKQKNQISQKRRNETSLFNSKNENYAICSVVEKQLHHVFLVSPN